MVDVLQPVDSSRYKTYRDLEEEKLTEEMLRSDFAQRSITLDLDQVAQVLLIILGALMWPDPVEFSDPVTVVKEPDHPLEAIREEGVGVG